MRDGYRCVITGAVHLPIANAYPDQFAAVAATHGVRGTQCAHIFAPSTSQDTSGDNEDGPEVKLFF